MRYYRLFVLIVMCSILIFACNNYNTKNNNLENVFSIPRTPRTSLSPGQYDILNVPEGRKVVITDIYIENLGGGISILEILEQRSPNSFELRYTFKTDSEKTTIINFTTRIMLGDESPIKGAIRIRNASSSKASILPRINGSIIQRN